MAYQRSKMFHNKPRSFSMSKLMENQHNDPTHKMNDLYRTKSFCIEKRLVRVFLPHDLEVVELLGKGSFAQSFKVIHRKTQEVMVLKGLPIYGEEKKAELNFFKEIMVLKSLHHKNVLSFIGVLYKNKQLHFLTEYVAGGSLSDLLHDLDMPLSWLECNSFAKDIACGMAYLHSNGIIHRNLKASNCLVKQDRTITVTNFGFAKIGKKHRQLHSVGRNTYTLDPEMMDIPIYEEIVCGGEVDVYSFGIVLEEIIGRLGSDPNCLPPTKYSEEHICTQWSDSFKKLAMLCCDLNSKNKPSFEILKVCLNNLQTHITLNNPVPPELLFAIENFQGDSSSIKKFDSRREEIFADLKKPLKLIMYSDQEQKLTSNPSSESKGAKEASIPPTLAQSKSIAKFPSFKEQRKLFKSNINKIDDSTKTIATGSNASPSLSSSSENTVPYLEVCHEFENINQDVKSRISILQKIANIFKWNNNT